MFAIRGERGGGLITRTREFVLLPLPSLFPGGDSNGRRESIDDPSRFLRPANRDAPLMPALFPTRGSIPRANYPPSPPTSSRYKLRAYKCSIRDSRRGRRLIVPRVFAFTRSRHRLEDAIPRRAKAENQLAGNTGLFRPTRFEWLYDHPWDSREKKRSFRIPR